MNNRHDFIRYKLVIFSLTAMFVFDIILFSVVFSGSNTMTPLVELLLGPLNYAWNALSDGTIGKIMSWSALSLFNGIGIIAHAIWTDVGLEKQNIVSRAVTISFTIIWCFWGMTVAFIGA